MYQTVHLRPMGRQALLAAVIANLERDGIGDRSLREIAAAVGSSHRMLIHHFGSRQGLLTEIVRAVEADQRAFLASVEGQDAGPAAVMRSMWERLSDPRLWPAERLFFECYARACRGEEPYARLLPGLVDDWLNGVAGPDADDTARAEVRAALAMYRGLLLDLVGTGDRAGVDQAFEAFLALVAGGRARAADGPEIRRPRTRVAVRGG
jgi:AcrR family transcriptional regulator